MHLYRKDELSNVPREQRHYRAKGARHHGAEKVLNQRNQAEPSILSLSRSMYLMTLLLFHGHAHLGYFPVKIFVYIL